jgi:hypothetical protein
VLRWILLGVLVFLLYRGLGRTGRAALDRAGFGTRAPRPPGPAAVERTENLVRCERCGVHFPESRALAAPAGAAAPKARYCSTVCRDAAPGS